MLKLIGIDNRFVIFNLLLALCWQQAGKHVFFSFKALHKEGDPIPGWFGYHVILINFSIGLYINIRGIKNVFFQTKR